jgi:hypothetical protein
MRWTQVMTGALAATVLFAGCRKGDGDGGGGDGGSGGGGSNHRTVMKAKLGVSLANVKGFVIAPGGSTSLSAADGGTSSKQLYSLNADGSLTALQLTESQDENGETVTTETPAPLEIQRIDDTPKFVFFSVPSAAVKHEDQDCAIVAARKSDSALFCVEQHLLGAPKPYHKLLDTDETGDVIFLHGEDLTKLDFTDPNNPTSTVLAEGSSDGTPSGMAVNSQGDVIVNLAPGGGNLKSMRLYKRSGGFMNLPGNDNDCFTSGVGAEAANFYFTKEVSSNTSRTLHRIQPNGGAYDTAMFYDDSSGSIGLKSCWEASLVKSGSIVYASYPFQLGMPGSFNYFVELVNGGTPVRHTVSAVERIDQIYGFDGGIVVRGADSSGNSVLVRYLAVGTSFTTLLTAGEYTLSAASVAPSGEVTFSGRRAADNARILGSIPAGSTQVTIIPQTFAGDVSAIQRIQ